MLSLGNKQLWIVILLLPSVPTARCFLACHTPWLLSVNPAAVPAGCALVSNGFLEQFPISETTFRHLHPGKLQRGAVVSTDLMAARVVLLLSSAQPASSSTSWYFQGNEPWVAPTPLPSPGAPTLPTLKQNSLIANRRYRKWNCRRKMVTEKTPECWWAK